MGDHIDTDAIIAAKYINQVPLNELYKHAMESADPDFLQKISKGHMIVAGKNFGCGSSREVAPLVLKDAGISVIIAESMARIFYRNAINIGLPVLTIGPHSIAADSSVSVDLAKGRVTDQTTGRTYSSQQIPQIVMDIIEHGGLVNYLKKHGDFIARAN